MGWSPDGVSTSVQEPSEVDDLASSGVFGGSEPEVDGLSGEAVVKRKRGPRGGEEGVMVSSETSRLWVW